jgi:hypothetical protein
MVIYVLPYENPGNLFPNIKERKKVSMGSSESVETLRSYKRKKVKRI